MFKLVFIFFVAICINFNIFASDDGNPEKIANPYFKDNYGVDDNSSSFKAYGLWSIIDVKDTNFPDLPKDPTGKQYLSNPKGYSSLLDYGYGAGMSFTTFFTKYVGVELGISGIAYKVHKGELNNVQYNYTMKDNPNPGPVVPPTPGQPTNPANNSVVPIGDVPETLGADDDQIYSVPFHATLQVHFAPYGGIRPYIGGGYHGNYVYSPIKAFDINFMHGPVIQAGVDFVGKDDTIFTIELKKYFVTDAKINYKRGFLYDEMQTKAEFSPIIISAGIGFKF